MHDRGWPDVSRAQSMVMTNIVSGIVRPSDIARNLGISRQAIHSTINQMIAMGIVGMEVDPQDRRHMVLSLTELGLRMREDAQRAMDELSAQVAKAIGPERFETLLAALEADWGDNIGEPRTATPS